MDCAIIGLSLSTPQDQHPNDFFESINQGHSYINPIPESRWQLLSKSDRNRIGKKDAVKGLFLHNIQYIDPSLFGLPPIGLLFTDPRQRLLIQQCWNAIEDAGISIHTLKGKKVGVFVASDGMQPHQYTTLMSHHQNDIDNSEFIVPGNNPSFLANRLSYLFDFKGPSLVVNTTCTGTYNAIHLAKTALEKKDCDMAIVGAVSLNLHLKPYLFESSTYHMASFSKEANGYISSEGCGALVLQPLPSAKKKQHAIYGVIKGTGTNSGGKTRSFTTPSLDSLSNLFQCVLTRSKLNASHITYIEAHGSASHTGDAIELSAIATCFKRIKKDPPCYVTTAKPAIGHMHAASGLYTLVRTLIALTKGHIPPIPNIIKQTTPSELNNTNIHLATMSQTHRPKITPRYAFLSSYGFSNVNAALVIERAAPHSTQTTSTRSEPVLICLSTHTTNQTKRYAKNILNLLNNETNINLQSLAYTLHIGRNQMPNRVAIMSTSVTDLKQKLSHVIEQHSDPHIYTTESHPHSDIMKQLLNSSPTTLHSHIKESFHAHDLTHISALWTSGLNLPWASFYKKQTFPILHLPTYPFEKKAYWIDNKTPGKTTKPIAPLLDQNISTFESQAFKTTFTKNTPYLTDHHLNSQPIVPATVFLEMSRSAATLSATTEPVTALSHIAFPQPCLLSNHNTSVITKLKKEDTTISFNITLESNHNHCFSQGYISLNKHLATPPPIPIKTILKRCPNQQSKEACYTLLNQTQLTLGPYFQCLNTLYSNENEAISHIEIPSHSDKSRYLLHPAILDTAFQTALLGLRCITPTQHITQVPFFCELMTIYTKTPVRGYVHARFNPTHKTTNTPSMDIDILDETGNICVSLRRFQTRPFKTIPSPNNILSKNNPIPIVSEQSYDQFRTIIRDQLSKTLHIPLDQLNDTKPFDQLGLDSIMIINLTNFFEKQLGPIPKTLFFDYPTITSLATQLSKTYS